MSALYANPVPFKFFAELIDQLSKCTARPKLDNPLRDQPSKQIRLVQRWIDQVKRVHGQEMGNPLPPGTVIIFFRLLFPEEGVRRRYGLQEYTFAKELEKHYRVAEGTFADWCRTSDDDVAAATGSLGETVKRWLERKGKCLAGDSALTLGRIDELLDELASTSTYSARDVQALRAQPHFRIRPLDQILFDLLHPLDASQTALMIQLILRDLSPILYPAPSESVSVSLNQYTSTCYDRIDLVRVMHAWDPRMARIHRTVADLDWVAATVEDWIRKSLPALNPALSTL
ncbi:uncharacterized protein JCM15063_005826 [Sporobolomyces koalae]|uniref:uncharacterized protein n=1 Tax=Sporobolomyces koalae TaxID=500713 RepID=UPI003171EF36